MKEKHIFAGNNTSLGFYSYFDYIINPEEANHLFILKGGPGVGKSSFMKKFGAKMLNKGYLVEYIHCSSDSDSLDGIMIPELKIAFVDGTTPHTIDPKVPGAADEIINLGEFLDSKKLEKHKNQILLINKGKSQLYKSAYRFLKSSKIISEEINSIYDQFTNQEKFNLINSKTINSIFPEQNPLNKEGSVRKLFLEAYTANGYISYTDSLCENKKIWAIVGENSNYTSKLLENILNEGMKRGYTIEGYYRPLHPDKLQHLYFPELDLVVRSAENHLSYKYDEIVNLHKIMDTENLKSKISEIENNLHLLDLLIKSALEKLSETKKYHELLEVFYINNMHFEGVNDIFNKILSIYS